MKAYVIKNKEGKMLCWHHIVGYYFDHFNIRSLFYMQFGTEKETKAVFKNKEFDNTDCTIVPLTICEGDLEEENRVMKKALELACETIHSMMPDKPLWICGDALARKYNIPNTPTIKDYDYFIQQAKESERDE